VPNEKSAELQKELAIGPRPMQHPRKYRLAQHIALAFTRLVRKANKAFRY